MVKRSATIAVLLLTLALGAYADGDHWHYGNNGGPGVPEPGSLLVFGTGILLSFKALRRKT
jgi:hypothetical protein